MLSRPWLIYMLPRPDLVARMGRPRIHSEGTTASQRVAASTAALVGAGGARKTFRLSPDAHEALQMLMLLSNAPRTETELIERLLLSEKDRFLKSVTKLPSTTKY